MMNCQRTKELLPLWVGQDLPDAASAIEVANHLEHCSDCNQQRDRLQASLESLQNASAVTLSSEPTGRSLWPGLVSRISDWEQFRRQKRFNGWLPASAMALAVALMVAVSLPSIHEEIFGEGSVETNVADLFDAVPEFSSDIDSKTKGSSDHPGPRSRPAFGTAVNYKLNQW